ncbi:MAG TPA: hypothetical protein VIQ00_13985 [Chitinophagaceae bacterium]
MKKITVILLLALMLVEVAGLYGVFIFQRQVIKKEMKAWMHRHREELEPAYTKLVVNKNAGEIHWEDENEFSFSGRMYDLVEKKLHGDQLVLVCISDEKETTLLDDFAKNIYNKEGGNSSKKHQSQVIRLVLSPFILQQAVISFTAPCHVVKNYSHYSQVLPQVYFNIITPPPRLC